MKRIKKTLPKRNPHVHPLRHFILVGLSILLAILLSRNESFHSFILHLGMFEYVGAFIAGILIVSTFTVSEGILILLILAERLNLVELGIVAGLGGVLGDLIIFRVVKDDLSADLVYLYKRFGGHHLSHVLHSRYFHWTLPVIGALIIASPFPDEIGVSLMGISKMSTLRFASVAFLLDFAEVIAIVLASSVIKP